MLETIISIFLILHGLVHLLYLGQSQKFFELRAGFAWPQGSWAFSGLMSDQALRGLTAAACALAAIGFVVGGVGRLAAQDWWTPLVIAAAVLSSVAYLLLWNGRLRRLDDQGGIGILINLVILAALQTFYGFGQDMAFLALTLTRIRASSFERAPAP